MKSFSIIIVAMLALFAFVGCQGPGTTPGALPPLATTAVTVGANATTIAALSEIKNPVTRVTAASAAYDVAKAVSDAAGDNPNFSTIQTVVIKKLSTWNSPYQPLVQALVVQVLADAQANLTSTSDNQAARQLIRAAMLGVQFGAQGFLPDPPTTGPS